MLAIILSQILNIPEPFMIFSILFALSHLVFQVGQKFTLWSNTNRVALPVIYSSNGIVFIVEFYHAFVTMSLWSSRI